MSRYRAVRVGGCLNADVERRTDGAVVLRSAEPLQDYPERLTDRLEHWAREAPHRVFVAMRERRIGTDPGRPRPWRTVTYAQMLERAKAVGQALARRPLSPERPVAILSENDLEHLTLALGAMWVGVPHAPVSPAYSLLSQDHAKLREILDTLTPGLVFASGPAYARAIAAAVPRDAEVVLAEGRLDDRETTRFESLAAAAAGAEGAAAHARVHAGTIVKFLFTSGSTRQPKGVVNTHRMLCANQQMIRQAFAFLQDEPPVLVDWLPWNHTFGGNHNVGIALYNGGTLYIDEGRPTAAGIGETLANLREISPTVYFNVPKGFEEIAAAMPHDERLSRSLLGRVKAFMFAGAGLSQAVWDRIDAQAERTAGERIRMLTGLGMTETAPSCTFALGTDVRSGWIGLPCPGVEVKLVPVQRKMEIRFRGPNVMPGYWRAPEQTAAAFDEEGFYRTGDAVRFVDPADPRRGLVFDGRIAEDFKLSTGTFVSVGPLRARVIADGAPLVQDAVVAAPDRDDVGLLVFPRLDECRRLAGLGPGAPAGEALGHPAVRGFFQRLVDRQWQAGTGSANRVARAIVLAEPPHIDRGEATDKGSINQRAVLAHRAALVQRLYDGGGDVLVPAPRAQAAVRTEEGHRGADYTRAMPASPVAPHGVDPSCLRHLAGYHLAQADIPLKRAFVQHIGEPFGLRPVEFTILALVAHHAGVTGKQLAQVLAVTAPNITLVLDRMTEKGLLERVRSETDRRAQNIHLTPSGDALAERALDASRTMEHDVLQPLSEGERAMLLELLQKVARRR